MPKRLPQSCASLRLAHATWVGRSRPVQLLLPRARPELRHHRLDVARPFQTISAFTKPTGATVVSYWTWCSLRFGLYRILGGVTPWAVVLKPPWPAWGLLRCAFCRFEGWDEFVGVCRSFGCSLPRRSVTVDAFWAGQWWQRHRVLWCVTNEWGRVVSEREREEQ